METVIIRQKYVKRLAKNLLKEMFEFLHDEYILTEFEEMKEVQKEFLKYLALNHIWTLSKRGEITEEEREVLHKPFLKGLLNKEVEVEYDSKFVEDAMKDDGIDTEGIYSVLNNLKLDSELDEDLYFKTKSFLDIYRVFYGGYKDLED